MNACKSLAVLNSRPPAFRWMVLMRELASGIRMSMGTAEVGVRSGETRRPQGSENEPPNVNRCRSSFVRSAHDGIEDLSHLASDDEVRPQVVQAVHPQDEPQPRLHPQVELVVRAQVVHVGVQLVAQAWSGRSPGGARRNHARARRLDGSRGRSRKKS
jgi:hypothetical protein